MNNDPTGGSSFFMYNFTGNNSLQLNVPIPVKNSIIFWVYLPTTNAVKSCNLFSSTHYKITLDANKKIICIFGNQTLTFTRDLPFNKWTQISIVSNGKEVNGYFNNIAENKITISQPQDNSFIKFGEGFQGFMYGMRMYPYELTIKNISDVYNFLKIKTINETFTTIKPLINISNNLPQPTTTTSFQMTWSTIASNRDGTMCIAFSTSNTMYISFNLNNWGDATKLTSLTKAPAGVKKCVISDDGTRVVISTQTGLYVSTTSNRKQFSAWQPLDQNQNFIDVVISGDNNTILGAVDNGFVYISRWNAKTNAWNTFEKINEVIVKMKNTKLSVSQNGQIIMITGMVTNTTTVNGVTNIKDEPLGWISKDGGNNFISHNTDMLGLDNSYSYKHAMSNDGKTIVLGTKYFYISTDYGNNWSVKFTSSVIFNTRTGIHSICGGNYENIYINDNGNVIVANDSFNMYISIDSGNTWYVKENFSNSSNSSNKPENPNDYKMYSPICLSKNGAVILYGMTGMFKSIQYINLKSILPTLPPPTKPVITRMPNAAVQNNQEANSSSVETEITVETEAPVITKRVLPTFPPTPRPIQPRSSNQNKFPVFNGKNLMYNQVNRQMKSYENFETISLELKQMLLPDLEDPRFQLKNFNPSNMSSRPSSTSTPGATTPGATSNKWTKEDLKAFIRKKLNESGLTQQQVTPAPDENKPYEFELSDMENQLKFKTKDGAEKLFQNETQPNQPSNGQKDKLNVSVQDNTILSGYLFSLLNTQNMQKSKLNTDTTEPDIVYIGNKPEQQCKFRKKCTIKHNYHPNCQSTIDTDTGHCTCVCSDYTLIGDGTEHTHCDDGKFDDLIALSSPSETFDSVFAKVKSISIGSDTVIKPKIKTHDPGMNELLELASNYYILLLKNKEMFDKMKDVIDLTNTTGLFHQDANTEYRENFTKIVNLGLGIGISFALIMMFRSK